MLKSPLLTLIAVLTVVLLVYLGSRYVKSNFTTSVTVLATLREGDPPPTGWVLLAPADDHSYTYPAVFCRMESFDPDSGTATVKIDGKTQAMLGQSIQYEIQVGNKCVEATKTIQIPIFNLGR